MKSASRVFAMMAFAFLVFAGCHEPGHVNGPGDYGGGNDVVGEVRYVDTRAREIELRSESGRTVIVKYDNRTRCPTSNREISSLCARNRTATDGSIRT
jgi:hypothetical protein